MEPTTVGQRVIAQHASGELRPGTVQAFTPGQLPDGSYGSLVTVVFDNDGTPNGRANLPPKSVIVQQ
jgi:hypothetical protein